ncbi:hypothetical protein FRC03_007730 [Tulasnella sp. 419]|nr:hypothetical protein FRC03_007730 [Tulasnella sp. 419]
MLFGFGGGLPLGPESETRSDLVSLRHGIDTASPLVVHGMRTGAVSASQGRRFFCLQRDVAALLREVIEHEKDSKWQKKNVKDVKNAIQIGYSDLDAMYRTLSILVATHAMDQAHVAHRDRSKQRRKHLETGFYTPSHRTRPTISNASNDPRGNGLGLYYSGAASSRTSSSYTSG